MNIKKIIRESLLNEVGTATSKPYKWELDFSDESGAKYSFITEEGSNLKIEVTFVLTYPNQIENIFGNMDRHPYYYWDVEFVVVSHETKDIGSEDKTMTISGSKYKSNKNELYRIMATISSITKDFVNHHKVRGFVYKPASDSRSRLFTNYFQNLLPTSEVITLEDGSTMVKVDDSIEYVKGENPQYDDDYNRWYNDDDEYVKKELNTKFNKYGGKEELDFTYNPQTKKWERKGLLNKIRRKLGVNGY